MIRAKGAPAGRETFEVTNAPNDVLVLLTVMIDLVTVVSAVAQTGIDELLMLTMILSVVISRLCVMYEHGA